MMNAKTQPPSVELLHQLLSYDEESGLLFWKERGPEGFAAEKYCIGWNKRFSGKAAGTTHVYGYVQVNICGKIYKAHRIIFAMQTGRWPLGEIDHIDGVRANNRFVNLRDVSKITNHENQRVAQQRNAVGLLGVSWWAERGKYRAQIHVAGVTKYLGLFTDPKEAHQVYLDAKRKLHAGCTI